MSHHNFQAGQRHEPPQYPGGAKVSVAKEKVKPPREEVGVPGCEESSLRQTHFQAGQGRTWVFPLVPRVPESTSHLPWRTHCRG